MKPLTGERFGNCHWTSPCSNKEKQFLWKIIHNALFTESKLQLMGMLNGICHFCKTDSETLHHLFYQCRISQKVENALNTLLRNILNATAIKIQLKHLILVFFFFFFVR